MIVISKKDTKRLIKGHRYEVDRMWVGGSLIIKNIGSFNISNFTDINGNEVQKANYNLNTNHNFYQYNEVEVRKGDILVCESDHFKLLAKGGYYKVHKVESIRKTSWNSTTYLDQYVWFVGINRKFKFNNYNLRKLNAEESREISLSQILDNEEPKVITDKNIRKIDLFENKDDILIKNLAKSIIDISRHHLSIVEWACKKTGDKLKIDESDYEPYLNMTLGEILKKVN